uniref:Histidine acid phosphatase n=1 Tax=Trichuris muris TaxID=70415 RepID=A0A5S6QWR2_TRIMR
MIDSKTTPGVIDDNQAKHVANEPVDGGASSPSNPLLAGVNPVFRRVFENGERVFSQICWAASPKSPFGMPEDRIMPLPHPAPLAKPKEPEVPFEPSTRRFGRFRRCRSCAIALDLLKTPSQSPRKTVPFIACLIRARSWNTLLSFESMAATENESNVRGCFDTVKELRWILIRKIFTKRMFGPMVLGNLQRTDVNSSTNWECNSVSVTAICFRNIITLQRFTFYQATKISKEKASTEDSLLWQPVPVHTTCRDSDLLFFSDNICPALKALNIDQSSVNESYMSRKYEQMFIQLQELTGWNPVTLKRMSRLADTLLLEKNAGLELPQWAMDQWTDAEENRMMPFLDIALKLRWYWQSVQVDSEEKIASISGFLVPDIVSNLQQKMRHSLKKPTKMRIYAMHDKNMRSLLCSIGSCSSENPAVSSCLAIELQEKAKGEFAIEIFYRNGTEAFQPVFIAVCGSFACDVEDFKRAVAHVSLWNGIEVSQACYSNKSIAT